MNRWPHFFVSTDVRLAPSTAPVPMPGRFFSAAVSLLMWILLSTSLLACAACQPTAPLAPASDPATPAVAQTEPAMADSDPWPGLLAEFVTDDGGFRYAALVADQGARQRLTTTVEQVAAADLTALEGDARLAFLINAYNVLVVQSVVDAWPVDNVLNVPGFFDVRTHRVAGLELTLNGLENDHIRTMGDPRIHFAVNCASTSCPPLAAVPYRPDTLDSALEQAAVEYVRATTRVLNSGETLELSKIFEWFVDDFAAVGGIGTFVRARLTEAQQAELSAEDVEITFAEYDWALNGR